MKLLSAAEHTSQENRNSNKRMALPSPLLRSVWFVLLPLCSWGRVTVAPRHCRGGVKHLHLAVGKDPSTQMTVSFASKWAHPDVDMPLAGVHIGTAPTNLDRFVGESELPDYYASTLHRHEEQHYYSPYQHHITIEGLEPGTTYYYVAVLGNRTLGLEALKELPLRDHPSQHGDYGVENYVAENKIMHAAEEMNEEEEHNLRALRNRHRQLGPSPYDGHEHACLEGHQVRSFTTAPAPGSPQATTATFAIVGDLGQFSHSQETVEHMAKHKDEYDAAILVGDIAYTEFDHRRWDTFFDFLDDFSAFDEIPLQIATGNHGK